MQRSVVVIVLSDSEPDRTESRSTHAMCRILARCRRETCFALTTSSTLRGASTMVSLPKQAVANPCTTPLMERVAKKQYDVT